jgi:hypothetical protein
MQVGKQIGKDTGLSRARQAAKQAGKQTFRPHRGGEVKAARKLPGRAMDIRFDGQATNEISGTMAVSQWSKRQPRMKVEVKTGR